MKRKFLSLILAFAMTVSLLTVGTGAVEPTSGGSESTEKQVNLVLVDGQSNAYGGAGTMNGADGTIGTVYTPDEGTAFLWEDNAPVDMYGKYSNYNEPSSVGFHPALAKALYEQTQIPSVIIHLGHSGQSISKWSDSTTGYTEQAVKAVEACRTYLTQNGYMIVNSGYIWMQGESDACPNYTAVSCTYTTLGEYYDAYTTIHNAYIRALGEDAVGGIITVQTRRQLNGGVANASEYCGVRAAQQALANQLPNLVIVSDITDGWRSSINKSYFASKGGNIHYSQAGYNKIGADAGKNLAAAWGNSNAPTGFELIGFDGSTKYSENGTIDVKDNLIYIGSDNAREKGAAQLVVKTLPVSADCDGVTMTLTDGADNAVSEVITNNGYIADASKISNGMKLTVTMGEISKTYSLTNTAVTEEPNESNEPDYYWDFTTSTAQSVTGDGWAENALTATTIGSDSAARTYYKMSSAVSLPRNGAWTIEWQGTSPASCVVLANNDDTRDVDGKGAEYIYVANNSGSVDSTELFFVKSGGASGSNIRLSNIPDAVKNDSDATWYIIHDGNGNLTLAVYGNGQLVKTALSNVIDRDYSYNAIKGYYITGMPIGYNGNLDYMKIYHEAAVVNGTVITSVEKLPIVAPVTAMVPQTTVNGQNFAGTISWTGAPEKFAAETEYEATVKLTANDGYVFSDETQFSIPGAESVGDKVLSKNARVLTFTAKFAKTNKDADTIHNFYWTFTNNTAQSVTEDGWTENALTATTIGSGGAARTYYKMSSAVSLPKDGAWTIEWKGTSPFSCVVLANNDDVRDVNGKGAEYIYVANNSGSADSTELFFVKSGGASGSNIRLSNIPDAVKNNSDATWYIIHDGNGNLTLAVYGNGQLVKTTLSNVIDRDYSYNAIKGYYITGTPIGYNGNLDYMKIYHEAAELPVAKMNNEVYTSLADAVAAAPTETYPNTPTTAATITLLTDVESGFDIGVESHNISNFKTQNIEIDLNSHTLKLGHPPVGSSATLKTNGLRVLAFSKLTIRNGNLIASDGNVLIAIANYGTLLMDGVNMSVGEQVLYTINNRGDLTLQGATKVPDGKVVAITNEPYDYPDTQNINAKLNVASETVEVGNVQIELGDVKQSQTNAINSGVPEINISAGSFGKIYDDGKTAKTPIGNITGGTFSEIVPENLCGSGYISVAKTGEDGKFTVKQGEYIVEMTVNGKTTKYESINDAVANAPVDSYANGKQGQKAAKASIKLLKDTTGGFDVGVETGSLATWKIQNIEIDLNGKTLTLGQPLVGSTGTKTNGIRVLAYSELTIRNGKIKNGDARNTALRGLQNYGVAVIEDVEFADMSRAYDTIGNFGSLELKGHTIVPNGRNSAILNDSYLYSDDSQVPYKLVIKDANVSVGKITLDLSKHTHGQTGTINAANPELTITTGNMESISASGSDKTLVGGVTGGSFDNTVPENLCGAGYIPVTKKDENGKYTVTIPHTITFDANGGVVTSTTANTNGAGTLSELPTPVRDGYRFNGWFTAASGGTMITTSTVFGANTTVYAQWTYVSNPSSGGSYSDTSYDVAIDKTEHGIVTVSPKSASKGDRVTVTVKPDNGYVLDDLTVTDKNGNELKLTDKGNGKYTFTMPSGRVEVKASFAKEVETSPFADVAIDDYYYEAVKWAVKNGITTGVGNDLFAPGQPCTRAQIVTFLWRAAGSPEPKGAASGMTDVVSGSYYEKAVAWAIENGVTTGTTATTFSPDATCTRAQAVTFLARALNAKAASAAEFSDVPTDSYFADAVAWAAANGVTEGIGGGLFGSDNDCTRGQIVTFLYRAYNK